MGYLFSVGEDCVTEASLLRLRCLVCGVVRGLPFVPRCNADDFLQPASQVDGMPFLPWLK